MADVNVKVILKITFLILSKVEANFAERKLTWKTYGASKALPTTKQEQKIG